jgi:hypothetical protein
MKVARCVGDGRPIRDTSSGRARCDEPRSRREHAALDGGADAFADLLGERRLRRSIEFQQQRLGHAAVVHDFCWFLVLFSESEEGQFGGQRRATAMNIKDVIVAARLALATPAERESR